MAKQSKINPVLRDSILQASSQLFIERGFEGTSIHDIASALGLTRTAIYYYFKSKEAILEALIEGVTYAAEQHAAQLAESSQEDPAEALRRIVVQHARLMLSRPEQFRIVERNESNLPEGPREAAAASRRALLRTFVKVIQRGIDSGRFRITDPTIAAFSIIGMCNWATWWYKRGGRNTEEEIAQSMADFALHALWRRDGREPHALDVQGALDLLREDVDYLEMRIKQIGQ